MYARPTTARPGNRRSACSVIPPHGFTGLLLLLLLATGSPARSEFAFGNGDTVVFLGDSNTAAGGYTKIIENYTLLRYPTRRVRFINAGIGGDTAEGGLARLRRDVFAQGATALIVTFGINDIGWGMFADDAHRQRYLDAMAAIVAQSLAHGVRVFVDSYPVLGDNPETSDTGFLQTMCDAAMDQAQRAGASTIDVGRTMRAVQRTIWEFNATVPEGARVLLHASDGIHLNDLGHQVMAFALLKGLGAPADVSSATIDAATNQVLQVRGSTVTGLQGSGDELHFTRQDEGLPLTFILQFGIECWVSYADGLGRQMLSVRNLPSGTYDLAVDGRTIATLTAEQLALGVNVSSLTTNGWLPGGDWMAQAQALAQLTAARYADASAGHLVASYLGADPYRARMLRQQRLLNAAIERLQRAVATPFPYEYTLRRSAP